MDVKATEGVDDSEFNDDFLDDSMELHESNRKLQEVLRTNNSSKGNSESKDKDANGAQGSNKVYSTSPSKLQTKFGVNTKASNASTS